MKNIKTIITAFLVVNVFIANAQSDKIIVKSKKEKKIWGKAKAKKDEGDYHGAIDLYTEIVVDIDPNNSAVYFDIGNAYLQLAETDSVKDKIILDNLDYYERAEEQLKIAINIDPDKPLYYYELGCAYFNKAMKYQEEMNDVKMAGSGADVPFVKDKRDALIAKSCTYFENAFVLLSGKANFLIGQDLKTYKNTLETLERVYTIQNEKNKADEMHKKLISLN